MKAKQQIIQRVCARNGCHCHSLPAKTTSFYYCLQCGICHTAHSGGINNIVGAPLGYPGSENTIVLRHMVHEVFDPIWRSTNDKKARSRAYKFMAKFMGLSLSSGHIACFGVAECRKFLNKVATNGHSSRTSKLLNKLSLGSFPRL